jgi:hypothetical protein
LRRSFEHVVDADLLRNALMEIYWFEPGSLTPHLGSELSVWAAARPTRTATAKNFILAGGVSQWQQAVFLMVADLLYALQGQTE